MIYNLQYLNFCSKVDRVNYMCHVWVIWLWINIRKVFLHCTKQMKQMKKPRKQLNDVQEISSVIREKNLFEGLLPTCV